MNFFIVTLFALFVVTYAQIVQFAPSCGQGTQDKVVGGQIAKNGSWAWQIGLAYYGRIICGGSIVNDRWVVTAAHCTDGMTTSSLSVFVGLHDRNNLNSWTKQIKVEKIVQHERYDSYKTRNDISMLKLAEPVTLDSNIEAVCIPDGTDTYDNSEAWVTGFGLTVVGGTTSRYLMEVQVPILSNADCTARWRTNGTTQVCAGYMGLGRDSCNGDSGGPLVKKGSDGRWHLIGLTSYGARNCGDGGVYTRLSAFTSWMENAVANN